MTRERTADLVAARLRDILTNAWADDGIVIAAVRRLTGGASRETWAFSATSPRIGDRELIARLAPASSGWAGSLSREAAAMRAAATTGVPVPSVEALGHDDGLGAHYMVMPRCAGETIPRRILRDPRLLARPTALTRELGQILATIHAAEIDPAVGLPVVEQPLDDLLRDLGGTSRPPAGLALGLRWLRDNPPPERTARLLHGDFRMGNLMLVPGGVSAVLDWELCHVGNPVADLGWLCAKVWRFGGSGPVGGVGNREDLLEGYETVAGWRPGVKELRWWELFATVRWGLMCGAMAARHLRGEERSVELVAIGRRSAEQEFDVLEHLDPGERAPALEESGERSTPDEQDVFGVPTASDLLEGVHHYLTTGPMAEEGALGFHARVAANVVTMVRRELVLGTEARSRCLAGLASLGMTDEHALSGALLDGSLDIAAADVRGVVRDLVLARIAVANPRHAAVTTRGDLIDAGG